MIAILALLAVAGLVAVLRRRPDPRGDLPSRVVTTAASWLPGHRRDWGRAMVAELGAVHGNAARWRFAAAALRVAVLPPARRSGAPAAVAGTGIAGTVVATVASQRLLPTLAVFVAALGLLLTGCATALAGRWRSLPTGRAQRVAAGVAAGGLLAATCAVVAVAAAVPAATQDPTHVASLALAVILCGYVVAGLSTVHRGDTPSVVPWAGAAGAAVAAAAGTTLDIHDSMRTLPLISPVAAVATVTTAVVVAAATGSRVAGRRAGLLTTLLGAPVQFGVTLLLLRGTVPPALLGDDLGGDIVRLAVAPVAMYVLAALAVMVVPRSTDLGRLLYR